MLFNSLHFLAFFPLVVLIYFLLPRRARWAWLLGASYYFYAAWRVEYLALILVSTLTDYTVGRRMGSIAEQSRRTKYLLISLVVNLGILFTFKYFNFFNDSTRSLFALLRPRLPAHQSRRAAACRHLVLHLPNAQLHHRRLARAAGAGATPGPLCALHRLFPPARGRAD